MKIKAEMFERAADLSSAPMKFQPDEEEIAVNFFDKLKSASSGEVAAAGSVALKKALMSAKNELHQETE